MKRKKHGASLVGGYDFSYYFDRAIDPLTAEQEAADIASAKSGDVEAWDRLCRANVRWVIKFAAQFVRHRQQRLPIEDAVQAGMFGLCVAIRKFDLSRGLRLLTYATNWIRAQMGYALVNYGVVSVPMHYSCGGPRAEEGKYWPDAVAAMRCVRASDAKTEHNRDGYGHLDIFEIIPAKTPEPSNDIEENEEFEKKAATLRGWLFDALNPKDQEIIARRFGLDGRPRETLPEIGRHFGITRERVRQREFRAKMLLRKAAGVGR